MLVIGTYLLVNQKLNIGAFIATEIVVLSIMAAVEKLIISLESYYDVIASLAKLNKVTELAEEKNGEIIFANQNEGIEIEFKNVDFYFNSNVHILQDINCIIRENAITVISGELGSGKSLLLNMMAGFYEPPAGSVLLNKIPLKNIDKEKLRTEMGVYLEDMRMIQGTVQDNILMGNENINMEDVMELSERIGTENISSQFTSGFFTEISETDPEISFSSKKKILLLRALIGEKKLLLLEDPVDGMNEIFKNKMLQYLKEISYKTTIVIVSQNSEIIDYADHHLHLKNGTLKTLS